MSATSSRHTRVSLGRSSSMMGTTYFEHPYLRGEGDAEFNGVGFARAEVEHPSSEQADYLKEVMPKRSSTWTSASPTSSSG